MNPYYEYFEAMRGDGAPSTIGDVYEGANFQRGYGIDENWEMQDGTGIMQWIQPFIPFVKKGLQFLGKQALSAVGSTVSDTLQGSNVGAAAKTHFTQAGKRVLNEIPAAVNELTSKGSYDSYNKPGSSKKRAISSQATSQAGASRKKKRRLIAKYPGLRRF